MRSRIRGLRIHSFASSVSTARYWFAVTQSLAVTIEPRSLRPQASIALHRLVRPKPSTRCNVSKPNSWPAQIHGITVWPHTTIRSATSATLCPAVNKRSTRLRRRAASVNFPEFHIRISNVPTRATWHARVADLQFAYAVLSRCIEAASTRERVWRS